MALRLWFFFTTLTSIAGLQLQDCSTRTTDWSNEGYTGKVVTIECNTNEPIYFKTGMEAPILSSAENAPWSKPKKLPGDDGPLLPAPSMMWDGNFELTCGSQKLQSEQPNRYPTDYLFITDPVANPVGGIMIAFGAKMTPTPFIAKRLAFNLFTVLETVLSQQDAMSFPITPAAWEACLLDGSAKIGLKGIPAPIRDPSNGGKSYFMTDAAGTPPTASERVITPQNLKDECDKSQVFNIQTAFARILEGMENATTKKELDAERSLMTFLMGSKEFASCYALMQTFYSSVESTVQLMGSSACVHAESTVEWLQDPCCNPVLRWSQCCIPGNREVLAKTCQEQNGMCMVNSNEVAAKCGAAQSSVTFAIEEIVAPSIFETNHPQYGCRKIVDATVSEKAWKQNTDWARTCQSAIESGKSKTGQTTCELDSDCYTACKRDAYSGDTKRCQKTLGADAVRPMFRCMLLQIKGLPVAKHIGAMLGATIGPQHLHEELPDDNPTFSNAYASFSSKVVENNCAGEEARMGWCANSLTQTECELMAGVQGPEEQRMYRDTAVKWIDDPSSSDPTIGWCVMTSHESPQVCMGDDESCGWGHQFAEKPDVEAQAACNDAVSRISACLPSSSLPTAYHANQGECQQNGGTWKNYGLGTYHRLQTTRTWSRDPATGEWDQSVAMGNEFKCTAEKVCNWDPWGNAGVVNAAQCIGSEAPESILEGEKKMFCGQCDGNKCEQRMSLPTCVVLPWSLQEQDPLNPGTCKDSGDGDTLPAATYDEESWHNRGRLVHSRCYRTGAAFDTEAKCLPSSICPDADPDDEGRVYSECSGSFCYREGVEKSACDLLGNIENGFHWKQSFAYGNGLCVSWMFNRGVSPKEDCVNNHVQNKWWEGRAWVSGWLTTQQTCETGYCEDHMPGEEFRTTCSNSKMCTRTCEVCSSDKRWDGGGADRICFDPDVTTSIACDNLNGADDMVWDNAAEKCKRIGFAGDASECVAPLVYMDCNSFSTAKCKAGCKLTAYTTLEACYAENSCNNDAGNTPCWARFDWKDQVCMVESGAATTSQTICQGLKSTSGPQWTVTNAEDHKVKAALQCRWNDWGECPNQVSCEAAGWCEDWELRGDSNEFSGVCIKLLAADDKGEREDCSGLQWAGLFGCRVSEVTDSTSCAGLGAGYAWMTKAKNRAECDAHGSICRDKYRDWMLFGGFTTAGSCAACGSDRIFAKKAHYSSGQWRSPSMFQGTWTQRKWASKNDWMPMVSLALLQGFAESAMAHWVGEAYWTELNCLLSPLIEPLLLTACGCGNGESPHCDFVTSSAGFFEIPLGETTLDCNEIALSPPVVFAAGEVSYQFAQCVGGTRTVIETVKKVAVRGTTERRLSNLRSRHLSECASHAIVTDGQGETVGQKMGAGLSTLVARATMCVQPSVPSSEVCPRFNIKDFVGVNAQGVLSTPLNLTTTVDAQGRYCATMPNAGTFMPIQRTDGSSVDVPPTATTTPASAGETRETAIQISGALEMTIPADKIDAALDDPAFKSAIEEGIATIAAYGVDKQYVSATLTKGSRRLTGEQTRRLSETATVIVAYTITLPSSQFSASAAEAAKSSLAAASLAELTSAINMRLSNADGSTSIYTVTVTTNWAPTSEVIEIKDPTTSQAIVGSTNGIHRHLGLWWPFLAYFTQFFIELTSLTG